MSRIPIRILRVVLPIVVVGGAGGAAYLMYLNRPPVETQVPVVEPPSVRIQRVTFESVPLTVSSQGTVQPRTSSQLVPEISGPVIEVAQSFAVGGFFEAGDVLLKIDPYDYQQAVITGRAQLAQAQLRVAQEEAEAEVARREWQELGRGDASALTLRQPQVDDALAAVASADAALDRAARDLERAEIKAPYAGRVQSKDVDIGQFVNKGTAVARIYAVDSAEIRLPLPDEELAYLNVPMSYRNAERQSGSPVTILAAFGGREHTWQGRIVRTESEIDPVSRMVHVVAEVRDPYAASSDPSRPPLASGMFVEAEIEGRTVDDVVILPWSALRGRDQVLVVDDSNRLRFRQVEILRSTSEEVLIRSGLAEGEAVCISALDTVTDGMLVQVTDDEVRIAANETVPPASAATGAPDRNATANAPAPAPAPDRNATAGAGTTAPNRNVTAGSGDPAPTRTRTTGAGNPAAVQSGTAGAGSPPAARTRTADAGNPAAVQTRAASTGIPAAARTRTAGAGIPAAARTRTAGAGNPTAAQARAASTGIPAAARTRTAGAGNPAAAQARTAGAGNPAPAQTRTAGAGNPAAGQTRPAGAGNPAPGQTRPAGAGDPAAANAASPQDSSDNRVFEVDPTLSREEQLAAIQREVARLLRAQAAAAARAGRPAAGAGRADPTAGRGRGARAPGSAPAGEPTAAAPRSAPAAEPAPTAPPAPDPVTPAPDSPPAADPAPAAPIVPAVPRVAMLPFSNLSRNPADNPISDALTSALRTALMNTGMIGVIPLTADDDTEALDAAGAQDARWLVGGAFQRVGDQLRITARVIEVADRSVVGSIKVDGAVDTIEDLTGEMVAALRTELGGRLSVPTLPVVADRDPSPPAVAAPSPPVVADRDPPAPRTPGTGVALAPFVNISRDPNDARLTNVLTAALTLGLRGQGQAPVVTLDISDAATALEAAVSRNATWLIEGGYQRVGEQLRVTAQIHDVATGELVHSVKADGRFADLRGLLDEVVAAVRAALDERTALRLAPRAPGTAAGPGTDGASA